MTDLEKLLNTNVKGGLVNRAPFNSGNCQS